LSGLYVCLKVFFFPSAFAGIPFNSSIFVRPTNTTLHCGPGVYVSFKARQDEGIHETFGNRHRMGPKAPRSVSIIMACSGQVVDEDPGRLTVGQHGGRHHRSPELTSARNASNVGIAKYGYGLFFSSGVKRYPSW
jgi:hypothetical protein